MLWILWKEYPYDSKLSLGTSYPGMTPLTEEEGRDIEKATSSIFLGKKL
mgnify:CR=1 FL=1